MTTETTLRIYNSYARIKAYVHWNPWTLYAIYPQTAKREELCSMCFMFQRIQVWLQITCNDVAMYIDIDVTQWAKYM